MAAFRDKAAIAGIGATEFSKRSGRSELQLGLEATLAALEDAGISPRDVDGFATFTLDNNPEMELYRGLGASHLRFFGRTHYGGSGAYGPVVQAAMAVITGIANVVVCYRAMNERSEYRFGRPLSFEMPTAENVLFNYHLMHGLCTPAAFIGMRMRRYMHETGATREDFANISISARRHAATNPKAFYYKKPITLDDYMSARMIADPFCLLDCCQESDGAVAVIVTTTERARSLRQKPVLIRAAAESGLPGSQSMSSYYRSSITANDEMRFLGEQLYATGGVRPGDIQVAILYDAFGPAIMPVIEALDFCPRGEAKDFIKNGNIQVGGRLPINTHGGQVGEAYIHGMNGLAEAVRQVRGTAVNQVAAVENVIVTTGGAGPSTGVILSAA